MNKEYTGEQVFSEMLNMLETRLADAQSELAYAEAKKRVI